MPYRYLFIAAIVVMGVGVWLSNLFSSRQNIQGSIYDFTVKTLEGATVDFDSYRGKYVLIVNTASRCGYTPQYKTLQTLHETHGHQVAVLGFPANDFLWQEPGTNEEIAEFCGKNYGVTFQMFEKISVRGRDQHPLYQWLSAKSGKKPTWNFCKYLIDKRGEVTGFYGPKVSPMDKSILNRIAID